MDNLDRYRQIIKNILTEYAKIPYTQILHQEKLI